MKKYCPHCNGVISDNDIKCLRCKRDIEYTIDDVSKEYICRKCGKRIRFQYHSNGTHGTPQLMRIYTTANLRKHLQSCFSGKKLREKAICPVCSKRVCLTYGRGDKRYYKYRFNGKRCSGSYLIAKKEFK